MISNININDTSIYNRCKKKNYTVRVSKPPIGTCIINKFEQIEAYNRFCTDIISVEKFSKLSQQDKEYLMTNASIVSEKEPIAVLGTQNEIWLITNDKLTSVYETIDGNVINSDGISSGWVEVKTITNKKQPITWFLHIPKETVFDIINSSGTKLSCNNPLAQHGDGDYIVCFGDEFSPNLSDCWVVNGNVFPNTYEALNQNNQ